jgi:hypothetical protein
MTRLNRTDRATSLELLKAGPGGLSEINALAEYAEERTNSTLIPGEINGRTNDQGRSFDAVYSILV